VRAVSHDVQHSPNSQLGSDDRRRIDGRFAALKRFGAA
jgi:hypothetical protein